MTVSELIKKYESDLNDIDDLMVISALNVQALSVKVKEGIRMNKTSDSFSQMLNIEKLNCRSLWRKYDFIETLIVQLKEVKKNESIGKN